MRKGQRLFRISIFGDSVTPTKTSDTETGFRAVMAKTIGHHLIQTAELCSGGIANKEA